ncbi:MAG: hypothetical protein VYC52_00085, partial [Pseudomonadota bacterium]|nr:hypothetical protein [Pseudomonadota bacterium]
VLSSTPDMPDFQPSLPARVPCSTGALDSHDSCSVAHLPRNNTAKASVQIPVKTIKLRAFYRNAWNSAY